MVACPAPRGHPTQPTDPHPFKTMVQRRKLLRLTAACLPVLGAWPLAAVPQVIDINDAINKAGRQRMLSQRLAKSYMALGQKVQTESAERILDASLALFDRQLVELKAFAPTGDIRATYAQLEARWADYKTALIGTAASRGAADTVLSLSGQILALANKGTLQLEAVSGKDLGRLVNLSGRQRMLSQRMAALYLGATWGIQVAQSKAEIQALKEEFLKAHQVLKTAPQATDAIRAELGLAETQFVFFDAALMTLQPSVQNPQNEANVFTTSERILQVMDNVTGLYAKVA